VQAILFPEPSYSGPEKVVYFNATSLEEELNRNKKVVWIVTFYTVWSPSCVNFASIYAKLSAEYVQIYFLPKSYWKTIFSLPDIR
jgi:thiol-disulfide isomerase/thioredoxin